MSLPVSGSSSQGFEVLDERIKRWIWREGWTMLRDAQEQAIPALIDADRDVVISAATAAGKTEAAFFPILTYLLRNDLEDSSVLYVGPLKALINDQWGRLSSLCESLEVPVTGWHGDVSVRHKNQFLKKPNGILLITPESLEAMFVRRGNSMPGLMANLRYMVVDELHAFIGSERGKQLQSLMHRVELAIGRKVPRVGLSATLGDMRLAAHFLRPASPEKVHLIEGKSGRQELRILLKGYTDIPPKIQSESSLKSPGIEDLAPGSTLAVAEHLYKVLRGTNNLVFPNSRRSVETYSDLLRRSCERDGVPNEFWVHHGSLAKEYREDAERALKEGTHPATAICTTTLELGIDIGSVKSICQIGPPPSVASLRQRLGRSGRRKGEAAILRSYSIESALGPKSGISDHLREGLVQSISMIRLLIGGWFEPPRVGGIHGSTLVQQILSIIAERGGAHARQLWEILAAADGPFYGLAREDFLQLLKRMGELDLLCQERSGLLLHGERGEKLVNNYEFFSAFTNDDEFRLVCEGKTLGSLPVARPLLANQCIIFAGRRWRVIDVDTDKKLIVAAPDRGGAPPAFDGGSAMVHDRVRQEMRALLASDDPVLFLDDEARSLLDEGRSYFRHAGLDTTQVVELGNELCLLTWSGDWANDALVLLLAQHRIRATNEGLVVTVIGATKDQLLEALRRIIDCEDMPLTSLLSDAKNILREKWDWAMPDEILLKSYASLCLDMDGARATANTLLNCRSSDLI